MRFCIICSLMKRRVMMTNRRTETPKDAIEIMDEDRNIILGVARYP
jgi:hypothetical protein